MSLAEFQRALADLVARPELCRRVRTDGDQALAAYELSDLERERLVGMARHHGMVVNCTVYRSNRLTALVRSMPETCERLRPWLRDVLDEFCEVEADCDLQWLNEGDRFATFLRAHDVWGADAALQRIIDVDQAATHARLAGTR